MTSTNVVSLNQINQNLLYHIASHSKNGKFHMLFFSVSPMAEILSIIRGQKVERLSQAHTAANALRAKYNKLLPQSDETKLALTCLSDDNYMVQKHKKKPSQNAIQKITYMLPGRESKILEQTYIFFYQIKFLLLQITGAWRVIIINEMKVKWLSCNNQQSSCICAFRDLSHFLPLFAINRLLSHL